MTDDGTFTLQLASAPTLQVTTAAILNSTGSTITVNYSTLTGNQPKANKNCVGVWQAQTVPFGFPPEVDPPQQLSFNNPVGSEGLGGLSLGPCLTYVIGLSLGPIQWTTKPFSVPICATATVDGDGTPHEGESLSIGISPGSLQSSSVVVSYKSPSGFLPAMFNSWIGLYEGHGVVPFSPLYDPDLKVNVPGNSNETDVPVNYEFKRSSPYTLVGFAGPATTTAAAILQFETA